MDCSGVVRLLALVAKASLELKLVIINLKNLQMSP